MRAALYARVSTWWTQSGLLHRRAVKGDDALDPYLRTLHQDALHQQP